MFGQLVTNANKNIDEKINTTTLSTCISWN